MTAFIARIKSRSIVSMRCRVWKNFTANGGFLGTGFRMWGINATARVLIEYTNEVSNKELLLDPIDTKKDLYGFAYAPERNSRALYDPFTNAAAYHQ
jgi:hypothetical protein